LSFGFWFIIMSPGSISHDNAHKKLFTLSMVTCQESYATQHTLQLVFIDQLSQHPSGTQRYLRVSWMRPCADPTLMFNIVATMSTDIRLFSLISTSMWATSASLMAVHGWLERCSSATDVQPSWNLSTHWYTFLSLIQLPPYCWIILLWISLGFTPHHKNLITERCSSLVQFSSRAPMILALLFELRLSCHRLHAVRTCPTDVSTCCSSFIRLHPILINIQSICPYLLKSLCILCACFMYYFLLMMQDEFRKMPIFHQVILFSKYSIVEYRILK
jgi:hypothetical protein